MTLKQHNKSNKENNNMLLNNFGAILANALADDSLTEGIKCTTGNLPVANNLRQAPTSRSALSSVIDSTTYAKNENGSSSGQWAFGFGDGTTPPTIEDYKFSGNLVEPTIVGGSGSTSNGSNGATFQVAVINNTESAMTINEIGLFSSLKNYACVMLTRDVLPEPVVLEPGASKGFQIFIDTQSFVSNAG